MLINLNFIPTELFPTKQSKFSIRINPKPIQNQSEISIRINAVNFGFIRIQFGLKVWTNSDWSDSFGLRVRIDFKLVSD